MDGCNGGGELINSFSLVSYLSGPLLGFLDELRNELVHECQGKAHLTVLPPRPLACLAEDHWQELGSQLREFQPFRVELGEVRVFQVTQVIYLSLQAGYAELCRIHSLLNTGWLEFREPFPYHPHLTLAQDVPPENLAGAVEIAARRWREFPHGRDFSIDRLTFVQNTLDNRWTDLASWELEPLKISI